MNKRNVQLEAAKRTLKIALGQKYLVQIIGPNGIPCELPPDARVWIFRTDDTMPEPLARAGIAAIRAYAAEVAKFDDDAASELRKAAARHELELTYTSEQESLDDPDLIRFSLGENEKLIMSDDQTQWPVSRDGRCTVLCEGALIDFNPNEYSEQEAIAIHKEALASGD